MVAAQKYKIFAKNIAKIRNAQGLSARELSEKAKLRQLKRVSDIEDGRARPTLEETISICRTLGYPVDAMLFKECTVRISINF